MKRYRRWRCPDCGHEIRILAASKSVRCSCGHAALVGEGSDADNAVDSRERERRESICLTCAHYNDQRCVKLDLGCRTSFLAALNAVKGVCPLGRWKEVTENASQVFWPGIHTRNLIYHVCALKSNNAWRKNIAQLKRRMRVFNGRKIVAVACGKNIHSPREVKRQFGDEHGIEYLELPNDPNLREVATFLPLLEAAANTEPDQATFYAHTKGNSTTDGELGAEMWRNAMYHHLLDHVWTCMALLETHPCVGTQIMHWVPGYPPYPSGLRHGNWMFSGTFFWFRNKDVFGHPEWRYVPQDRYGAEAYLSGLFEYGEGATVFQPWPVTEYPTPSPYRPEIYLWPLRDT